MSVKETIQLTSEKPEQLDIKNTVMAYLRYWYLFLACVVICAAAAFLYLRYATLQYKVTSTILIKDNDKGADVKSGNAIFKELNVFNMPTNLDNEIEVLQSQSLMERVLTELDLNKTYYVEGKIKDKEIYGKDLPMKVLANDLDSAAFNKTITLKYKGNNKFVLEEEGETPTMHKLGQRIRKPWGNFTIVAGSGLQTDYSKRPLIIKFHDIAKLAAHYNSALTVEKVNKMAMVVDIGLIDAVPAKGKDIVNKLIEVYNKEAIEDKNIMAAHTLEFVDDRLKYLTSELNDVERGVENLKRENQIADVSSQAQVYIEEASVNNQQITEWNIQIDVLESIEEYLKSNGNQYGMVPSTLGIKDPTLQGLIASFNELQLERERMLRTAQANNPIVQNMNGQLANLRDNIMENLRNVKSGLIITRDKLVNSSGQFRSKIQKVPTIERELIEINRQQGIKQALYLFLLQKREESAMSLAATVSNSRIIDPATVDKDPVKPKKLIVYLIAIILGFGIPFMGIYMKDLLNDKVQTMADVEKKTSAPIIGEITHNNTKKILLVAEKTRSPIEEIFHLIRLNLQFATSGKPNKVILVTSSMSGEGKTFFSLNLGASLALTGKKVAILGFDLRKPSLLQHLDLAVSSGISNYLVSTSNSIYEIIKPTEIIPDLYVFGSGPIPPNPAEMMIHPKVGYLINQLKEDFDHIIIDTAPVGQVADAYTLAEYVDSSIYVVRYNYTFKAQLDIINNIFKSKNLKQPMIVLNDAKKQNSQRYGYGYGYGYSSELDKKKSSKRKSLV